MVKAYLGLGSNIGDRAHQLQQAIRIIDQYQYIDVTS
ncbi:2-amino-4-hydroxy-6-hydroxymethyldihydropteridine pyrophosphokinase, partial [Vibrio vulnificus]